MEEMFSERARKAIEYSGDEAARLGQDYIGTEHILLGLIRLGEGRAVEIMNNLGLDLRELKASIEEVVNPTGNSKFMGNLPLTHLSKRILMHSVYEVWAFNSKEIDTEHLLLTLVRYEEGMASRIFSQYDVEFKDVYFELKNILSGHPSSMERRHKRTPPHWWR